MMTIKCLRFRLALVALMTGVLLGGCAGPLSADDSVPSVNTARNAPTVTLYKNPQGGADPIVDCSFPFEYGVVALKKDGHGCSNDDHYFFKLENVPSASRIKFYDDEDCHDSAPGNFNFTIRTIKHPTTMALPFSLQKAHSSNIGTVLAPGIQLLEKGGSGQVEGKLSCMRMWLSPAP